MTQNTLLSRLRKSKKHREAFVASQITVGIPFQVRALRKQYEMDQKALAEKSGMLQPRISVIERTGGGGLSLETLKRLASAFDVALIVKFVPFSELIRWSDKFSPDEFAVKNFTDETEEAEIAEASGATLLHGFRNVQGATAAASNYFPIANTSAETLQEKNTTVSGAIDIDNTDNQASMLYTDTPINNLPKRA